MRRSIFPASRRLFSFSVRWADEYGKRDFCHESKLTSIQPSNRMPHDMFADCDLSPLCPAHSFAVRNFRVVK